jgi:O-6-methylguanine DNA methyltransferase
MAETFATRVYQLVRSIPRGRVASYGAVAAVLGKPRAARGVGQALRTLPDGSDVPWWRVINGRGEVSIGGLLHGRRLQRALLEGEGVEFDAQGRVAWNRFGWNVRQAVSLAITDRQRPGSVLLVQRPVDDADLPDVWGLPAASLGPSEGWEDAALRAGRDKLGVELLLGGVLREGSRQRPGYRLHMRLVAASIRAGTPSVPQPDPSVTQYQAWRWGEAAELQPAAERGSLCSELFLSSRT